ncbi:peptidase M48 [Rhizobiales bacterium L72]|uniref:Peptidase M48 n=2 Tax=Propylenella binzhouense TaxID=2555902 RepID=A0A964T6C6_9HYPH|nr:peptidase M48 [Propylenella binzhouense]
MSRLARHRLRNLLESALLIATMALIVGLCTWTLWGAEGLLWGMIGAALALLLTPAIAPGIILSLYGARPLSPTEVPDIHNVLEELSRRAKLPTVPGLCYVPSRSVNAFAVGNREAAIIALTDGMLRTLNFRELANVLAHEVSHIANNDLWIMGLADMMSRMMTVMSYFGFLLLTLNLPLVLTGQIVIPWLLVLLLMFGPTIMSLLQLALSRSREFDADLSAAILTGDPRGLASALAKLERQGRLWENLFLPQQRIPDPSLLRTHPPTEERIRRLIDLDERPPTTAELARRPAVVVPIHMRRMTTPPRRRWSGLWY